MAPSLSLSDAAQARVESFSLSDAAQELCVVTLSHCDTLRTAARLLLVSAHWSAVGAQDSSWRALCSVMARDALLVCAPEQLLRTHGSYHIACRWLHAQRHTFKPPDTGEPPSSAAAPKFSIRVGVRFRPHGGVPQRSLNPGRPVFPTPPSHASWRFCVQRR